MKRRAARAPARAAPASAPRRAPRAPAAAAFAQAEAYAPWLGLLALAALLWTVRGAPLGVPVADDYGFLARLRFQHPLDPFDSMGATFYWRPLSRQLWFSLLGPLLFRAPWAVAAVSMALLAALYALVYRVARRAFPAPALAAAAVALFPVTSESARVLLDWPSGAQHLLAMVFAALAVHEALARRAVTAALAALAGLLSHESAGIALPVVTWALARAPGGGLVRGRAWAAAVAPAAIVAALWVAGYALARRHGVAMPPAAPGGALAARLPDLFGRALTAQLDLEDLHEPLRGVLVIGYGAVLALGVAMLYERAARRRLRSAWPALVAGAAWFALGTLPLVVLLPDWNAWRDSVPGLGLGFALVGFLAVASPPLALAFAGFKLVALLCAAPATPAPTAFPAPSATDMSFVRLARLQGIADDTRRALLARFPTLPHGADGHFAALPRMAEVGLEGPLAIRVWYGDSTITWGTMSSAKRIGGPREVVVAYDTHLAWRATVIEPAALRMFGEGASNMMAFRLQAADSLLEKSRTLQTRRSDEFESLILANQSRVALTRGQLARADSLILGFRDLVGQCADYYALHAGLWLARRDIERARADCVACFRLEPANKSGILVRDAIAHLDSLSAAHGGTAAAAPAAAR